jgi:hypothetical protein
MADSKLPRLRRRDFLALSVLGVGGLAVLKIGGRLVVGAADPALSIDAGTLQHLSQRQAAIVTAASHAMLGDASEAAYMAGRWSPASEIDALMGNLPQSQRAQIGLGLNLLEEWTWGLRGFSSWDRGTQRAFLDGWRTSSLAVHRSIWGFLHLACAAGFSGTEAGWEVMDYPGPCVGTNRSPGQTAHFEWDEAVP